MWGVVITLLLAQVFVFRWLLFRIVPFFQGSKLGHAISLSLILGVTTLAMAQELSWLKHTPLLPKKQDPFWEFVGFLALPVFFVGASGLLIDRIVKDQLRADFVVRRPPARSIELDPSIGPIASKNSTIPDWPSEKVLLVQAQEHYLSLTTESGNLLIRGRMGDAVQFLKPCEGIQPHRSWWISFDHIQSLGRQGRDAHIVTTRGNKIPISRARFSQVKQAISTQRTYKRTQKKSG